MAEALNRLTPGDHESARRCSTPAAEAVENADQDRPRRTPGKQAVVAVRPRLPRPHQPHDGADRQGHALQARLRPVRPRGLPRADVLSVPRRRIGGFTDGELAATRAIDIIDKQVGADNLAALDHRTHPGRGRLHRARRRASCPRCRTWCRENGVVFIADEVQTGFARTGAMFACDTRASCPT